MDDLEKAGIKVKNIWELLFYIMTELSHHFNHKADHWTRGEINAIFGILKKCYIQSGQGR
jgi:hypothetical protein